MDEDQYIDAAFEENRKKKRVAYLLWLFFGWFGVHRFYAGETKTGVIQLLLTLSVIGFALVSLWWWIIDAFLVPDMVNEHNRKTLKMLHRQGVPKANTKSREPEAEEIEPVRLAHDLDPKREAMLEELRKTGYKKERRDEISRLYR